jgi:glycoside hydrolase-like protein
MARGCDYSWDHPDLDCMKKQGAEFIVRYGSRDQSKNLTKPELDSALSKGYSVAVVWQEGKTQMLRGYSGGQTDARDAVALFDNLGLKGIPIYFSCDQDFEPCSSADKTKIDDYCNGAKSIVGKSRMGGYGDDSFCKRQFDAGRITYGWQTYAWSESNWEQRCQLRQVQNNVSVCSGTIDWDESRAEDFGQWPRPAIPAGSGAYAPGVTFDGLGRPWEAWIGKNGEVRVKPPGYADYAVDLSQGGATSGCSIAWNSSDDTLAVVYGNSNDEACMYRSPVSEKNWTWSKLGVNVKALLVRSFVRPDE